VKLPLDAIGRSSPPLLRNTSPLPARPDTLPPTLKEPVLQLTVTVVTLFVAVPAAFAIEQNCDGAVGCAATVMLYVVPASTLVLNVNAPLAVTARLSPPLFCSISPEPESPAMVPPTVTLPGGCCCPVPPPAPPSSRLPRPLEQAASTRKSTGTNPACKQRKTLIIVLVL
jgi:hypothetical protein